MVFHHCTLKFDIILIPLLSDSPHLTLLIIFVSTSAYNFVFDAVREFGMAQFKCKPSSNIRLDFPNHFMSLGRGVSPNFQPRRVLLRLRARILCFHRCLFLATVPTIPTKLCSSLLSGCPPYCCMSAYCLPSFWMPCMSKQLYISWCYPFLEHDKSSPISCLLAI